MPQAIGGFLAAIGNAIIGPVISGLTYAFGPAAAATILDIGIKLAALAGLAKLSEALFGIDDPATPASNFGITVRGTIEFQRIVYGETLISGPIVYINTAGDYNQTLYEPIALAGHEVSSITDIWLNDIEIPFGYIDYTGLNGDVKSGDFYPPGGPVAFGIAVHLGSATQTVDDNLNATFTEWTTNHKGQGIAYIVPDIKYAEDTQSVWSGGIPNNIKALVAGKKVYDPRSDGTQSFGTGPHRLTNSLTWQWSDNPALCWADYMIDQSLGFGEDSARIDYSYVASAAEYCDGVVYTPVGTDKRFRCNGALSTGDTYETNLRRILSSMNGQHNLLNGVWTVRASQYTTPTLQFNDDVLRGNAQFKLDPDETDRFNTVRGTFIDKDRLWTSNQFPEATSSEYVSRDNDKKLYRDVVLDMTKDVYAAQRLGIGVLEQSDLEVSGVLPTNFKTLPVELGGTIMYSNEKMNWTDKEFRVMRYKLSDMGGIDLAVREEAVGAYTDVATDEYTVSSGGGYVTAAPGVPPPSSLWAAPRIGGVNVHVTTPPARLYEEIVFYGSVSSLWTNAEEIGRVKGDHFFHQIDRPRNYYYFAEAVNFAGTVSDRIPNSSFTDVVGQPDLYGTRPDGTFDLSVDDEDFFDDLSSGVIVAGAGENGTNILRLSGNLGADGISFRFLTKEPVKTQTGSIAFRYKVNSWSNPDTPTSAVGIGVRQYSPTQVNSTKYGQTYVNTWDDVGASGNTQMINGFLTTDGAWHTAELPFSVANRIGSGGTFAAPYMAFTYSDTVVQKDYNITIDLNFYQLTWVN